MIKNTNLTHTSPTIIVLCILFVGIVIFLPTFLKNSKTERLDKTLYQSKVMNEKLESTAYSKFWKKYNMILKDRADRNGDEIISLEEKKQFDEQFFDQWGLTVDPVTKIVRKGENYNVDPDALICRLNSYYPDKPWIKPICTEL